MLFHFVLYHLYFSYVGSLHSINLYLFCEPCRHLTSLSATGNASSWDTYVEALRDILCHITSHALRYVRPQKCKLIKGMDRVCESFSVKFYIYDRFLRRVMTEGGLSRVLIAPPNPTGIRPLCVMTRLKGIVNLEFA